MSKHKILSLDGGGIRGLISAILVDKMDKETGFLKHVDMFAGTSTGGIIAIALADGVPIDKVMSIYDDPDSCNEIFKRYKPKSLVDRLLYFLKQLFQFNFGQILHAKYTDEGLEKRLKEVIGVKPLKDLDREVFVSSFQLDDESIDGWKPASFSNIDDETSHVSTIDAAMSTSAAQTYFPPHFVSGFGYMVDGGTFANNPSMFALAKTLNKHEEIHRDDVVMFSVGTGFVMNRIPKRNIRNPYDCGYLFWLKGGNGAPSMPLLSMLFDGSTSEKDTFEAGAILGDDYHRINPLLTMKISIDCCAEISKMQEIAEEFTKTKQWTSAVQWIEEKFCNNN